MIGKIIEQVNSSQYFGCNIATYKTNNNLEENIRKCNSLNAAIERRVAVKHRC
jgi:HJR/Mrr/RecB family endonuclease